MTGHCVWLVGNCPWTGNGLASLLRGTAFQVTEEFSSIELMETRPRTTSPALIFATMETLSDGKHALPALRRIMDRAPNGRVVAFDEPMSARGLVAAMKAGASAYLGSQIPRHELRRALDVVVVGEKVLPSEIVRHLVRTSMAQSAGKPHGNVLDV